MLKELHWENSREVIKAGQELISSEKKGEQIDITSIAEYALNVLRTMKQSPIINRQLHDSLHKYMNDSTRTGKIAKIFFDFAKRTSAANIDYDWELINFRSAGGLIGEPPLMSETMFRTFFDAARQITLPQR